MNDLAISFIRTVVPTVVGMFLAFLVNKGIDLDAEAQMNLIGFMTALFTSIYYAVFRFLETKYPSFGMFLGYIKQPTYKE